LLANARDRTPLTDVPHSHEIRSQPRSLLSTVRLNCATSRALPASCRRMRSDQISSGFSGAFWPRSLVQHLGLQAHNHLAQLAGVQGFEVLRGDHGGQCCHAVAEATSADAWLALQQRDDTCAANVLPGEAEYERVALTGPRVSAMVWAASLDQVNRPWFRRLALLSQSNAPDRRLFACK